MAARTMTPAERETSILLSDEDNVARIVTHQRKVMTKLRKNPAVTIVEEGFWGKYPYMRAEIPANLISYRTGTRARNDLKGQTVG